MADERGLDGTGSDDGLRGAGGRSKKPAGAEDYPQPGTIDDEVAPPFGDGGDSPAMAAERDELDRLLGGMTSENADDTMVDDVVGNECW